MVTDQNIELIKWRFFGLFFFLEYLAVVLDILNIKN